MEIWLLYFTVVFSRSWDTCKLVFTHPSESMDKANQLRICFAFGGFAPKPESRAAAWSGRREKKWKRWSCFGLSPSKMSVHENRCKCSSCGWGNCASVTGWNEGVFHRWRSWKVKDNGVTIRSGGIRDFPWWEIPNGVWKSHTSIQEISKPNGMSVRHQSVLQQQQKKKNQAVNPVVACGHVCRKKPEEEEKENLDSVMAWEKWPYVMPILKRELDVRIYLHLLAFSI